MPAADTLSAIHDTFATSVVQESVRPISLAAIRDSARILTCVGVGPSSLAHLEDMVLDPAKSLDFGSALLALERWRLEAPRPMPTLQERSVVRLQWTVDHSFRHWTTSGPFTPPPTP